MAEAAHFLRVHLFILLSSTRDVCGPKPERASVQMLGIFGCFASRGGRVCVLSDAMQDLACWTAGHETVDGRLNDWRRGGQGARADLAADAAAAVLHRQQGSAERPPTSSAIFRTSGRGLAANAVVMSRRRDNDDILIFCFISFLSLRVAIACVCVAVDTRPSEQVWITLSPCTEF
ncbi:hypothetical protein B0H19DRAFT_1175928 [Mycena capillaripes]|nr:hypothetical protein B0H19DRAFT_1175928 [Mycena capillaripes]